MRRLFKYVFRIAFFVGIGFVAYAIFADLPPPQSETVVTLPAPAAAQ